jgi:hypothetical protein
VIENMTEFAWRTVCYAVLAATCVPVALVLEGGPAATVVAITLTIMWAGPTIVAVAALGALAAVDRLRK